MQTFLSWPGWAGVSALAQVVALVTLFGAAWRFILQRRQMPVFVLDWVLVGSTTLDGRTYHVVEFHNFGRGTGALQMIEFFGARVHLTDEFRAPRTVGPGQTFRLLLTAPKLSEVWFRTMVRLPADRTRIRMAWFALSLGELDSARYRADRAWIWWSKLRQLVERKPVGPGSAVRAVVRAGRPKELRRIRGSFADDSDIYSLGSTYNRSAEDLEYYPGKWDRSPA